MHPQCPFPGDDRPLDSRQNQEGDQGGHRKPQEGGRGEWQLRPQIVRQKRSGAANETGQKERDEGRRVVRALGAEVLAASRAPAVEAEIGSEDRALAAMGASPREAAAQGDPKVAVRWSVGGFAAARVVHVLLLAYFAGVNAFPHGMITTQADIINTALLAFIKA